MFDRWVGSFTQTRVSLNSSVSRSVRSGGGPRARGSRCFQSRSASTVALFPWVYHDGIYFHEVLLEIKSECTQMEVFVLLSALLCVQTAVSSPVSTAAQAQVRSILFFCPKITL